VVDSTDESVHEGSHGGLMGVEKFLAFISQSSLDLLPTAWVPVEVAILVTSKYSSTWFIKAPLRPGAGTGLNEISSRYGTWHSQEVFVRISVPRIIQPIKQYALSCFDTTLTRLIPL